MKISQPISTEFWNWLVLVGWREVRMSKNKRRYNPAPAGTFAKLARVPAREREALYRDVLGPMTG